MFALILSLAAPAGAVFATEAGGDPPSDVEENISQVDSLDVAVPQDQPDEQSSTDSEQVVTPELVEGNANLGQQSTVATTDAVTTAPVEPIAPISEEPPVPSYSATGLVIVELQTRGTGGASAELVELYNASPEAIDITGWCVQRASAAGSSYTRMFCIEPEIPSTSARVLVPGYASIVAVSPAYNQATESFAYDATFSSGLADTGGRIRIVDASNHTIDLLGWGAATEFYGVGQASAIPSSGTPSHSLQRQAIGGVYQDTKQNSTDFVLAPANMQFEAGALYEVEDMCRSMPGIQSVVPEGYLRLKNRECVERSTINFCEGLRVNEIAANVTRQYIELVNTSGRHLSIDACMVQTNRSTYKYQLPELMLAPSELYVLTIEDTGLMLTKSTTGSVYLLASDGETEIGNVQYADLSVDTSWSYIDAVWKQTYDLTPGSVNTHAQYPRCEVGYERNVQTGRCRLVSTVTRALVACRDDQYRSEETNRCRAIAPAGRTLVPCKEGQYRSEETNRCRSLASFVSSLKPCADDQFRNPVTNRCKRIASTDDASLADCGEGRERNPTTNRCRNIVKATPTKADFAVQPTTQAAGAMWGWWALGGVTLLALGYAGWEWRYELRAWIARRAAFFRSKK